MLASDSLSALGKKTAKGKFSSRMPLEDGSRIAVIGAGPAGSMFSYFLSKMASTVALDVEIDLYEPRQFCMRGPAGCNHCGGIVSESLVQRLATEGIALPNDVVQRGIETYTLHMDVGQVEIETPLQERRIAAIFRGNGPRNSELSDTRSFDGYLQELARNKGANLIQKVVTGIQREGDRMRVSCADGFSDEYELVVMACGVNSRLEEDIQNTLGGFKKPVDTKAFVCEFKLGKEVIREKLGPSMHVFLLDIPRLEFAALIPKNDYATLCLLGHDIDEELMERFFSSPEVRNCFPGGEVPRHVCHCYPRINTSTAKPTFGDRLVLIGDTGTTRLLKDGVGAAYRTAKAAARTVVFHGVAAEDFKKYYWPLCRRMHQDNLIGKFVFAVASLIQKTRFARRGVIRMTRIEQGQSVRPRRMSEVLWDLFTGSASYRDVFVRTLHPKYIGHLIWNLAAGNLVRKDSSGNKDVSQGGGQHGIH